MNLSFNSYNSLSSIACLSSPKPELKKTTQASVGSGDIVDSTRVSGSESCRNATPSPELFGIAGYGEWFEGRRVRKLFGFENYLGNVTQFDKESGWFRVVYEDGDFEDLDWRELQEVFLPLDITVPLKSLAQKIIKKDLL
ncbi:hypothetical protein K2173_022445 [Erythroxylum novogranatense]|uniref:PTM/DIR17-like Tudor domain-containing protein n=1 Tax=Erythroxylum novogranatense TaxID=1862640 RepID=A0AAV8THR1_9ROSI|nr:hypothetical protein K2173_022445 [Erythroxylum novogranatense]